MFKRLWHQGCKGRFGAFRWPTFWNMHASVEALFQLSHFDDSELRAWNSAARLKELLEDRAALVGSDKIRLYAHSMGNVAVKPCASSAQEVPR
jgi:hypothetical protein